MRAARRAPREPAPALMRLIAPAVVAFTRGIQEVRVDGLENIPAAGPFVLASNHTCHLDALSVTVPVYEAGRVPRVAGRADLFTVPVLGWALRHLGQIPVYRSDVRHVPHDGGTPAGSVGAMSEVLASGAGVVIFPESTFTRDPAGWPMRAKTGVARLALAHPQAAVVPLAHWGNEKIIDPWSGKVDWRRMGRRRTSLHVRIGEPLCLERFRGEEVTGELLTEMTEEVMAAITGQLEVIRAGDVAAGDGPPAVRWDRKRDGDPFERSASARSARVLGRLERREARRRRREELVGRLTLGNLTSGRLAPRVAAGAAVALGVGLACGMRRRRQK